MVPLPAAALELMVVDDPEQIGLAAKVTPVEVGIALNPNVPDVNAAVHVLLLVTVTVNGPAVDTVPVAALLGLTPLDQA